MPVRAVPAGAALAALTAVTLVPQQAQAAPGPASAAPSGFSAGSYDDEGTGRFVGDVLGRGAEGVVRAAGVQPERVRYSQVRLDSARRVLGERAAIPGTAWVEDPRVNRIVVTADRTVTGARLARLNEVTSRLGEAVVVRRVATKLTRMVAGGDAIWGSSARCSLGFNVVKDGRPYFLTAGHCGKAVQGWAATHGGPQVAVTENAVFPGRDYALVKYTAADAAGPGEVNLHNGGARAVTGARQARPGEAVWRSGSTSGLHSGHVTGLNATVNYQEGQVTGLIKTDVCAEPGDSGGPLFSGADALGLTSGGSGNCLLGGETYYQPVRTALDAYGARIG